MQGNRVGARGRILRASWTTNRFTEQGTRSRRARSTSALVELGRVCRASSIWHSICLGRGVGAGRKRLLMYIPRGVVVWARAGAVLLRSRACALPAVAALGSRGRPCRGAVLDPRQRPSRPAPGPGPRSTRTAHGTTRPTVRRRRPSRGRAEAPPSRDPSGAGWGPCLPSGACRPPGCSAWTGLGRPAWWSGRSRCPWARRPWRRIPC